MRETNILVVEDEGLIAADLSDRLTDLGYHVLGDVATGEEALQMIPRLQPHLVLMDIVLAGQIDGIETAERITRESDVPVVFLTSHADPATIMRARATGPYGYLVKPFEERELQASIELALYRHVAEQRLRKMERWLATTLDSIGDGVIATDAQGRVTYVNPVAERHTGWLRHEAIGKDFDDLFPIIEAGPPPTARHPVREALQKGATIQLPEGTVLRTRSGSQLPIEDSAAPIHDAAGNVTGVVMVFRDRSDQLRLAEQRRLAGEQMERVRRLESLGIMAGGISHGFNNLLAGIMGNAALCEMELGAGSPQSTYLKEIMAASERASRLCQQMLDYAGEGKRSPAPLDLNSLTTGSLALLRKTVGRETRFQTILDAALPTVIADRSQIQQVITDIIMNAADAIGDRVGEIRLTTGVMKATDSFLRRCVIQPETLDDEYVFIDISDTGPGMPPENLTRIFDPFFTTKFTGRGLGLSAVLGIVRAHQGVLLAESIPGDGSTFRMLLPIARQAVAAAVVDSAKPVQQQFEGRFLVVDDEPTVRGILRVILEKQGGQVIEAAGGEEAIERIKQETARIDVAVLDLTMPGMDGVATCLALRRTHPGLPVLFVSGYAEASVSERVTGLEPMAFLAKPFTPQALLAKITALRQAAAILSARD